MPPCARRAKDWVVRSIHDSAEVLDELGAGSVLFFMDWESVGFELATMTPEESREAL